MLNYDDLLQKKLSDLESGASLDSVLQDLPDEAQDLAALLRLAASVRAMPHPEPLANQVQSQREQVMAAARANTRPIQRPVAAPTPAPRTLFPRISWKWLGAGAAFAAAGAMVVFLALVLIGANLWLSSRNMDSARVEAISGQVQVATNPAGTQWKNISTGYRLQRGDRVRTLGASSATLVYFEGTHSFLSANADMAFSELNGSAGDVLQVKIKQAAGEVWNKVTPFQGKTKSYFLVDTPSGEASVHGTTFNVKVSQGGQTQFAVEMGEVWVKSSTNQVTLEAGQATMAQPSGEIAPPTYQFDIQGSVTDIDLENSLWTISGVQVKITSSTVFADGITPGLGDTVKVTGRIEDGVRVAYSVEAASDLDQNATFTGMLEANQGDMWQISGMQLKVSGAELDPTLKIGDPVRVTFNISEQDGTWLALKIESLVEPEPEPAATATADPRAMPSYEFKPDEIAASSCGSSDFTLTGALSNTASETKDYAANVKLGYLIDRGGEYVSTVDLMPDGWSHISAKQKVNFDIHLKMNEKWAAAPENTQVKLRVYIVSATNRPDHLNGRLTVTVTNDCKQTPTPVLPGTPTLSVTPTLETPTGTLPPSLTETLLPSATPVTPVPEAGQCTGADPQPTGMKLAQRYGVSYDEIMGWFCQHYGFGEIDLAYSLSRQYNKPVEAIFAMRASGMGWGEIKKSLAGDGNGKKDQGGQDDGNGNGNGNNGGNGKKDNGKDKKDNKKN